MAEKSGFFNAMESSGVYDRVYNAADFARMFSLLIGSGIFVDPADQLMVSASSGLSVTIAAGNAFIDGYWYTLDESKIVTLDANTTSYPRTDLICCTLDLSNRTISVGVRKRVTSIEARNNGSIHDLVLASIVVGVGASTITSVDITDHRPDETLCGYVKGTVEQIQTGELFQQFEAAFNGWFEEIKGKLGTDPATQLQAQIDDMAGSLASQPTIRHGTAAPSDSVGKDGDIYIQIMEG